MNTLLRLGQVGLLTFAMSLAACGGGTGAGDRQASAPPLSPSAPTPVAVVGTVTGFGSVYVNGIRYAVNSSTVINIEGQSQMLGDDSGLQLGMKVRVMSNDSNGERAATHIEYDDDLRGVIESITVNPGDPSTGSFVVLGLTVIVDGNTAFDDDVEDTDGVAGIDIRDLSVGMVVEVSGYPIDGGYVATRVDRELDDNGNDPDIGRPDTDDDELELKGFVESIAADGTSLVVSGVEFLVNMGTVFDDGLMLNDDLLGVYVEVKADIDGGNYVAVEIEREDDFDFDDDDNSDNDRDGEFEIEGILQSVDTNSTPNTLTIDGITIAVTDASPLAGLVGMRVELKGRFNDEQTLVLREFGQEFEDNVETEDLVSFVDVTAGSFTTRLGLTITPTGASNVEDDVADDDNRLTPQEFVNRLQIGDRIEAKGFSLEGTDVEWTDIEREESAGSNDDFECELSGPVESIDGDVATFSLVIQGVTVSTTDVDNDDFEIDNGISIGRAAFFERLNVGDVVKAESPEGDAFCMPGMLDARELELETDLPSGSDSN